MRRLAVILSGLLVIQVAGAIALAFSGPDYGAFEPSVPLLTFDPGAVKEVMIAGEDDETVVLRRQDDGWILPDLYGFPVDGDKAEDLVKKVAALKRGLPVASSSAAAERFKLTEDSYERRIVLGGDDGKLGEILIGTSPSYRYVHARRPDDEAVFSVQFATYEAGTKPADWMDRDLLHLAEADIQRIVLPSLTLVRRDGGFSLEGLAEDESADGKAIDSLVGKIAQLSVASVEGKGNEALARIGEPELTVEVERKEAPTVAFRLSKMDDGEDYLLATSTQDYLFRVADYTVKPLVEASREKLIKKSAEEGKKVKPSLSEKPEGADGSSG